MLHNVEQTMLDLDQDMLQIVNNVIDSHEFVWSLFRAYRVSREYRVLTKASSSAGTWY